MMALALCVMGAGCRLIRHQGITPAFSGAGLRRKDKSKVKGARHLTP